MKNKQLAEREKTSASPDSPALSLPEAGLIEGQMPEARQVSGGPTFARKLAVCFIGGILMSIWNPLATFAEKDPGLSAYGEFFFFTLGTWASSNALVPLFLKWPIDGGPPTSLAV